MKRFLFAILMLLSFAAQAQKAEEVRLLARVRSLHHAVFVSKDSLQLEKLFSAHLSYGHSGGKVESKAAAIQGIIHNASVYENLEMGSVATWIEGNTAVTRYTMAANEKKGDGTVSPLKLHMALTWIRDKKEWRLMSRQAVRVI